MNLTLYFWAAFWALTPIFELRLALPMAVAKGMPVIIAFIYCSIINACVGPIAWIFLSSLHKLLYKTRFYKKIFDHFENRTRKKMTAKLDKYGWLGLILFVAIPLPMTGAWTGTLGGWIFGIKPQKVFLAVAIGVFISGTIIATALSLVK